MEKIYFSKQNFATIFDILKNKFIQSHNFDISTNPKFNKELVNIMKTVYAKKNQYNIPPNINFLDESRYLSQKTINVATGYFSDNITKSLDQVNIQNNSLNRDMTNRDLINTSVNHLSIRPEYNPKGSMPSIDNNYDMLLKQRDSMTNNTFMPPKPNFQENLQNENDDITKRFNEMTQNRKMEYENIKSQQPAQPTVQQPNQSPQYLQMNELIMNQSFMQNPIQQIPQQPLKPNLPNYNNQPFGTLDNDQTINRVERKIDTPDPKLPFYNTPTHHSTQTIVSNMNSQASIPNGRLPEPTNFNTGANSLDSLFSGANNDNMLEQQFNISNFSVNQSGNILTDDKLPGQQLNQPIDYTNTSYSDILRMVDSKKQFEPIQNPHIPVVSDSNNFADQFTNQMVNINETKSDRVNAVEQLFPKNPFDDTVLNKPDINFNSQNVELEVVEKRITYDDRHIENTEKRLEKLIEIMEKNDISKFYETIVDIPRLIQIQREQPLTIRTYNMIISSKDRDLTNTSFDKYNFRVVFGAEGDYTDTNYTNNNNQGLGSVDYSTKTYTSSGIKNPSVQSVLRNVISIKLRRLVLPKPRDEVFYPEPYLFVAVDEFNSNIVSTKTFNNKIFCKVHFDKEVKFQNRSYLYYINNDDDFTLFYSSPLSKLDRLTLKLLDSCGQSLKDTYQDIDFITTNVTGDTSLEFYNNTFVGDRILLRDNINYRVSSINSVPNYEVALTYNGSVPTLGNEVIVNLSNQLEYIFEVKIQEPDPTNEVRPSLT